MVRNRQANRQERSGKVLEERDVGQRVVVAQGFLTQTSSNSNDLELERGTYRSTDVHSHDVDVSEGFSTHTSGVMSESRRQQQQDVLGRMPLGALAQHVDQGCLPTPINVKALSNLLKGFDDDRRTKLVDGFNKGFTIPSSLENNPTKFGYTNHKSIYNNLETAQRKISKELELGRIAGPFDTPPFPNFIVSPLGLVPKKNSGEYRLIHDLSFPKGDSVNSHIDPEFSAVQYEVLDRCIELIQSIGGGCLIAKADLKDAFRIIPVSPASYRLLGFIWEDKFFYDRCLPMGCSISCQTFESLSQALQWILVNKLSVPYTSHILDDFIFFLSLADCVNLPIKHSKTVFPSTSVVLHGILVDTCQIQMTLPPDKVESARSLIGSVYWSKKVQLRTLQSLIGVLNFAYRVIVPGRAFLRHLINLTKGVTNPFHFIRLTS